MKRVLHLIALLFISVNLFAQAPQKMSYQSVIRNASNALVINAPVKMRISILQGSTTGNAVYSELHSATTNANGLVSIEIGAGNSPIGTFSSIKWGNGTYFLKTETDPNNGTNYTIIGTSQLLSVPYALHANCVSSSISGDTLIVGCKKYVIPGIIDANVPPTLNNGLVGYWPFNGNANDESGNGNNGTVYGAKLTTDRFGNQNKAYEFYSAQGLGGYILANNVVLKDTFSISSRVFWYAFTPNNATTMVSNHDGNLGYELNIIYGLVKEHYSDTNNAHFSDSTIGFNEWHLITWAKTGSVSKLYVDNRLISTKNNINKITNTNIGLYFGRAGWGGNNLRGKLDDIRIYNRALTQEEITWLANN